MVVTMVSHICLLVELGPICNSMAASLCLKSCEDHSLLKSYYGGLWKNIYRSGPTSYHDSKNIYLTKNHFFFFFFFFWGGGGKQVDKGLKTLLSKKGIGEILSYTCTPSQPPVRNSVNISRFLLNNLCVSCPIVIKFAPRLNR